MLDKKIGVIGYSGHAYVVIEAGVLSGLDVGYYADKNENQSNPFSLEYLGFEKDNKFNTGLKTETFILGIGDNKMRLRIAEEIELKQWNIQTVIHPDAKVSELAKIGNGTFVGRGACINPFAEIGKYSIINTASVIEHGCKIGHASHIAPGAVLAGDVKIGKASFIGANSVIKQGIIIGDNVIIGAGSVILKDVPSNTKMVGNPGREI